ncbi:MAG: acyl-CoA desaturase, partial [Usitatibacter sp.]
MSRTSRMATLRRWFDNGPMPEAPAPGDERRIDWPRVVPFLAIHLGCLGAIWVGASATAISVAVALFVLRMFAITAFYHRYFSHRAF